ncbi:MAG: SEC-C domain-containing protein, partial [Syntrophales bacterium]|nr:SEC-C domain-containing protein [Syntrophales bacterium]
GRNDPCPCGSGKKYKKCHLPAVEEEMARKRSEEIKDEEAAAAGALIWEERECEVELRRLLAAKGRTDIFPDLKAKAIEAITAPLAEFRDKRLHGYFEPLFAQIGFNNRQESDSFVKLFFEYYNALASQYKDHPRDKGKIH